ncbi:MAG: hypothetical protein AAGJ82_07030 [Bacteroidota bacterium]
MRLLLLPLFLLITTAVFSQAQPSGTASQTQTNMAFLRPGGPTLSDLANYGSKNNVDGTPYLFDDWEGGRVRFEGQPNFSEQLDVLLDLEVHQLNVKLSTGFIGEFPMERLDAVEVHTSNGDTVNYEIHNLQELFGAGDYGRRFFRVLHRGEGYLLLHQPNKYLRREADIENLGMVRRPDKYLERNRYWLYDGVRMIEVKRNQRQLMRQLPAKASTMKRLIRAHDLDVSEDEGLARLFELMEAG